MNKTLLTVFVTLNWLPGLVAEPWRLHVIDDRSRGADGVRLADVNKDGRTDIATGWEEGGRIRICLQPEPARVFEKWPAVTVGRVKSPEDAVFADVNADGWLDVVSCCEGNQKTVFFHVNPGGEHLSHGRQWKTKPVQASINASRWMFCEPLSRDTLILGSKEPNAQIAALNLQTGQISTLRNCGWIMSLRRFDIDQDGDEDIVYSDRKGEHRAAGWLENPGRNDAHDSARWRDHIIGGRGKEVMFLDITTQNDALRIACNTRDGHVLDLTPTSDVRAPWNEHQIAHPPGSGLGKAVAFADVDGDGQMDLVCTCGKSEKKMGAFWLRTPDVQESSPSATGAVAVQVWDVHDISGRDIGIKYDRIEMLDIDSDGDLDLLTSEERDNLGVIWYENPTIASNRAE